MSGNRYISVYGGEIEPNYIPLNNGPNGPNVLNAPIGPNIPSKANQEGPRIIQNLDRSRIYKFENKASGIILIKQDYKKLFYSQKKLTFPLQ